MDSRLRWDYHREKVEAQGNPTTIRSVSPSIINVGYWMAQPPTSLPSNDCTPNALWMFDMAHSWEQGQGKRQCYGRCSWSNPGTRSTDYHWSLSNNGWNGCRRGSALAPTPTAARINRTRSHNANQDYPSRRRDGLLCEWQHNSKSP
jgi:hypothetical protein